MKTNTDHRHIIATKLQGFSQTPQDIMEKYNGCSVPLYTAYRRYSSRGKERDILSSLRIKSQGVDKIITH